MTTQRTAIVTGGTQIKGFSWWPGLNDYIELARRPALLSLQLQAEGRGRNAGYPAPPAQIRTCATNAYGSYIESNTPTLPLHVVELIPETLLLCTVS